MIKFAGGIFLLHQAVSFWVERLGCRVVENGMVFAPLYVVACFAAAVLCVVNRKRFEPVGLWGAVVLGSLASNIFERLVFGGVVDWFFVGSWVVNSADVGIVVGLVMWVVRGKKK